MSDDNETSLPVQDELATLKARADMLGVTYHPSIGLDKLREKVKEAMATVQPPAPNTSSAEAAPSMPPAVTAAPVVPVPQGENEVQRRSRLRRSAMELVRIRITCMNPAKAEWEGEILTAGNSLVGTVKKYVPFNADEGWHVPRVIYDMLAGRQCQVFTTIKSKNGIAVRKGKLIKEFAIEILDPLTKDELQELAQRQALARSID